MAKEEIEKLYPEFEKWWRKKGYLTVGGVHLIKLWYEWLEEQAKNTAGRSPPAKKAEPKPGGQ